MSLNNGTADSLGDAICSALGTSDPDAISNWHKICRQIYSALKSDAVVTAGIPVSTTGSATAQTGATTAGGTLS